MLMLFTGEFYNGIVHITISSPYENRRTIVALEDLWRIAYFEIFIGSFSW